MEENKLKTIEGELEAPADFTSPDVLYRDLVASIRKYHPSDDLSMIEKAYQLADNAHKDQKRKSGEPYIIHPLCVAIILADLEMDKETIAAGLLHDVVEDTVYTEEQLAEIFGKEVALLVDGVTKLTQLSWSADKVEMQAENLRKMFLAWQKISASLSSSLRTVSTICGRFSICALKNRRRRRERPSRSTLLLLTDSVFPRSRSNWMTLRYGISSQMYTKNWKKRLP